MHASSALNAYSWLEEMLRSSSTRQSRAVWSAVQSFLAHAAVVSKILDPIRPDQAKQNRSDSLRAHLGVKEDSALLPRDARDNLEHIDERIDRWVRAQETGILEMVFEDRPGFEYICAGGSAVRRVLILDEMAFISEDRSGRKIETNLASLAELLRDLVVNCAHKLETESPYHYRLGQALLRNAR